MHLAVPRELDSPAVIADEVNGETLIINLNTGSYYVVPAEGSAVWSAISTGVPPIALLSGDNDPREAALRQYLSHVLEAGLLREATLASDGPVPSWTSDALVIEEHTDMADLLGLDPIHDADENVGWPMAASGE